MPSAAFLFLARGFMGDGLYNMASSTTAESDASAGKVLVEVQAHYTRAIQALNELIDRIQNGELAPNREMSMTVTDARRAMQTFFDERKKIEDQLRRDTGVVHGHAIDFESARVEIGRRLDRLRAG